jgi:DNA repair protein RadC
VGHLDESTLSLEGTTMVPTTFNLIRTFTRRRVVRHPDAVPEAQLNLPRRIDGPAAAAQVAGDLLRHRREDITLALYLDDRHRLVGTAILAVGWAQAARLSARPILSGSQACRATGFVLVRYRRWGAPSATEPEDRTFRSIAAACSRYGLVAVDHLVVVG